jgi:methylamine dehydrogenase accessory protein MauD
MDNALVVSHLLLWFVVIALALVVLALVRQVGALQARIAPVGALAAAAEPAVGEPAPRLLVQDLEGRTVQVGFPREDGKATLLVWVAPGCPVCRELLPVLDSVQRQERQWLEVLLASEGERAEHEAYYRGEVGRRFPYLLSAPLGLAYQVPKLPYAVLIDSEGVLRAKGLVNTREHVESLFEAMERKVATVQEYFAARERGTLREAK